MNQQQLGAVQMTTAMALSGGVGVWATWAALPSFAVVFWRCVFGFIALLAFMLFTGRIHRCWITRSQMLWSLAAGTTLVLNWVCFFQSFHYVSIGVATIVYQAQPLLVVVGGMVFFKERMGLNRWLWLGLGLLGMVILPFLMDRISRIKYSSMVAYRRWLDEAVHGCRTRANEWHSLQHRSNF